jgi:hypothetical protein
MEEFITSLSMPEHLILIKYPVDGGYLDLNAQKLHVYSLKIVTSIIIDIFIQHFLDYSKIFLEYKYIIYNALKVEFDVVILKTVKTDARIIIFVPICCVSSLSMLGAHGTSSL